MTKRNKRIYWIRHGESYSNTSELNYNIVDPELTPNGIEQCGRLKKTIKFDKLDDKIDLIVVSPLTRALQSCSNIFDEHYYKINFICVEEIREHIDNLCHKRKTKTELKNQFKYIDFSNLNNHDYLYHKTKGSETKTEVIQRCKKFLKWLKSRNETNIVVITHGNFLYPMFNNVLHNIHNKTFFSNCEMRITDIDCNST